MPDHAETSAASKRVTHLLTFDIEEWFHLVGVHAMDDRSTWQTLEKTIEPLTDQILAILSDHDVQATFFVLGWIAERYPAMIKRIAAQGHEIASHSHWHYEVYKHTPDSFRADLQRSLDVLGDLTNQPVRGFRAPSFSLTPGCEWAWDVMLDLGITYDASVFPIARAHGGYPSATQRSNPQASPSPCIEMPTPSGRTIRVIPMSTMRTSVTRQRIAFSGGGYFRVLPWRLIQKGFKQLDEAGHPAVLYLHPWDFAPGGPTLPMRRFQTFKCYYNRDQTEKRLRFLLKQYRFGPCTNIYKKNARSFDPTFLKSRLEFT